MIGKIISLVCLTGLMCYGVSQRENFYFYPSTRSFDISFGSTTNQTDDHKFDFYFREHHGLYYHRQSRNKKIVIVFHGNAGSVYDRTHLIHKFSHLNEGFDVYLFEYPGFGKNGGQPRHDKICQIGTHILKYFKRVYGRDNIILLGESIGTYFATYFANDFDIPNLILQSGPSSIADMIDHMTTLRIGGLCESRYNTVDLLKQYRNRHPNANVIVLHSKEDEIVPFEQSLKLQQYATKFIEIGGGHNNPVIRWDDVF